MRALYVLSGGVGLVLALACTSGPILRVSQPWSEDQTREFHFHNDYVGMYFAREHQRTDLRFTVYASCECGRTVVLIGRPDRKRYLTVVNLGAEMPFSAIYPLPGIEPQDTIEIELWAGRRLLARHSRFWDDVLELLPESSK